MDPSTTGFANIGTDNVTVKVINGKLEISNPDNLPVKIYDVQGRTISNDQTSHGIYFIQIGIKTVKIVL